MKLNTDNNGRIHQYNNWIKPDVKVVYDNQKFTGWDLFDL